jgi:hypothetical protein
VASRQRGCQQNKFSTYNFQFSINVAIFNVTMFDLPACLPACLPAGRQAGREIEPLRIQ